MTSPAHPTELADLERELDDFIAKRRGAGMGAVYERMHVDRLKARIAELRGPVLVDLAEDFTIPAGQVGWRCRYCGKGRAFAGTVRQEAAEARAHQAACEKREQA